MALVGAAALGLSLGTPSSAVADPAGEPLAIRCDELGPLNVIVVGRAQLAPGLVIGTNQVLTPYKIALAGVFTPPLGDPAPFADEFSRPAPENRRLDHCTFHQEGALPDGTFVIDGDIWLSYTPTP
jgi:hypothetical protein